MGISPSVRVAELSGAWRLFSALLSSFLPSFLHKLVLYEASLRRACSFYQTCMLTSWLAPLPLWRLHRPSSGAYVNCFSHGEPYEPLVKILACQKVHFPFN